MIVRRDTKQRQLVLETVRAHRDHPTADRIYLDVREADSKISRGTVYRNLKCLCDEHEIIQIKVPGADRFDLRVDYHYHFICLDCDGVFDVPCPYSRELDAAAAESTDFEIFRHRTVFEGRCAACRRRAAQRAEERAGSHGNEPQQNQDI